MGEIVRCFSTKLNKNKYFICIYPPRAAGPGLFMFISSSSYGADDLEFLNSDFPTIPPNATGKSVVGFSELIPMIDQQVTNAAVQHFGSITKSVAQSIETHANTFVTSLQPKMLTLVIGSMRRVP